MNRLARITFALTITSAIGMQIPISSDAAYGQGNRPRPPKCRFNGSVDQTLRTTTVAAGAAVVVAVVTGKAKQLPDGFTSKNGVLSDKPVLSDQGKVYAVPSVAGPGSNLAEPVAEASSVSLLEVSSETARELIAKCPTLSKQLANEGPFTMFLPSDEALASVKLDGAALETFLKRHVVLGRYSYSDLSGLSDGAKLQTLAETELAVSHNGSGEVLVAGVAVPNDARAGSNGFSYAIPTALP